MKATFLAALPPHARNFCEVEGLEPSLSALVARAREAWPDLELPVDAFVAHLAARLPPSKEPARALERLAAADLWLAFACARGDPAALRALEASQFPALARTIAGLDDSGALAEDVKQVLRERLLMPRAGGGPPRIADYAGHGPLKAWLKAAALRHALNLQRPGAREQPLDADRLAALPLAAPGPELELIRKRHKQAFADAFTAALATLDPRERTLLKLHTLDGLALERIGPLYGKDKSTISRWLSKAQRQLETATREHLAGSLALSGSELESVLRAAQSELSVSLSRLLAD